jgi:hypothetical protein
MKAQKALITGYVDGVRPQQAHHWDRLADEAANILFAEALEN